MVKFNGPTKSKLCLKISKEKYFMHLTLYDFLLQIHKKLVNFRFFWNPLSPTLTMNTGLTINILITNTGLAVNTITKNKACLYEKKEVLIYHKVEGTFREEEGHM